MFDINIIDDTANEPITLEMAKKYLRIQSSNDDNLVANLILSARQYAEKYIRISLTNKTIELIFANELPSILVLPYPPIVSIIHIKCRYNDDTEMTIDPSAYSLQNGTLQIFGTILARSITVQYQVGNDSISEDIKIGILRHVAKMYNERSNNQGPPASIDSIYTQYRVMRIW